VRTLAPGLRAGRFHFGFADAGGAGELHLRAEFGGESEARAFAQQLDTMIGAAALMTRKTPIGESLSHMRETSPVKVDGKVVQVGAKL
jgi:hypothetical protein